MINLIKDLQHSIGLFTIRHMIFSPVRRTEHWFEWEFWCINPSKNQLLKWLISFTVMITWRFYIILTLSHPFIHWALSASWCSAKVTGCVPNLWAFPVLPMANILSRFLLPFPPPGGLVAPVCTTHLNLTWGPQQSRNEKIQCEEVLIISYVWKPCRC